MNSFKKFLNSKFLLILALVVLVLGVVSAYYTYNKNYKSGLESILSRANTISSLINPSDIKKLAGNETDLQKAEYENLKSNLIEVANYNADAIFVYVMGLRGGNLYMIADSEPPTSEDYSPPGEIYYEESPALKGAFTNKKSSTEGPLSDRWGTWFTGASPIIDEYNNVVGVVGVDVEAKSYLTNAWVGALAILFGDIMIVSILIATYVIVRKENQKLEIREQFTAIASHEIRSPLSGLLWGINTLRRDSTLSSTSKELADDMYTHGQRLLTTLHNILDTYGSPKNLAGKKEKFDIGTLIKEAMELHHLEARKNKVEIKLIGDLHDACVDGDRDRIGHALSNVISNAVKYSTKGGVVTIFYKESKDYHTISVKDEGIGIPKEEITKVTNGFYRASNAKKAEINGSGLGLYLVKKVVNTHGGILDIQSDESGTTVTITLPKC